MRAKALVIALALAALPAKAAENFAGIWKGTGELKSTSTGTMLCEAATIEIRQSVTSFEFPVRKFMCDGLVNQWIPLAFGVTNQGVLTLDGKAIGTLKGNELVGAWKDHETDEDGKPTEPTYWEISTVVSGDRLVYRIKQTYGPWVSIVTAELSRK